MVKFVQKVKSSWNGVLPRSERHSAREVADIVNNCEGL